jgi:hypothetical protein
MKKNNTNKLFFSFISFNIEQHDENTKITTTITREGKEKTQARGSTKLYKNASWIRSLEKEQRQLS